jgi:fused signal recognition particle receptor
MIRSIPCQPSRIASVPAQPRNQTESADTGLWHTLRTGLARTRTGLASGIEHVLHGPKELDPTLVDDLESRLLLADVGVESTRAIIARLTERLARQELSNPRATLDSLRTHMIELLAPASAPPSGRPDPAHPIVILVVGVNGAGKTTTAGKLSHFYRSMGERVLLAAADTFRAAAAEQLQLWGKRTGAAVISHAPGADAAAVIFDALQAARARGAGIVIADTAGRLHTKHNLMDELRKVRRAIDKFDPACGVETLLVIDAGTGRNALAQAREFHAAAGLTGLIVTKLDGTARGGVVFALARELVIPIRFVGIGEQAGDLRPFEPGAFVDALLAED